MLRLRGGQVEGLWDELLPEGLRELPQDLAQMDALLRDEALLSPIGAHWDREAAARGRSAKRHGRPTIALQTYVRLMVLEHRDGWGYETLVREVSELLHLRRFCLVPLHEQVADESTVRKLTRRLGAEVVADAFAVGDRESKAREALPLPGGQDRLDGGGGGRALPDRRGAGARRRAHARPRGEAAAGEAGRDAAGVGDRSRAVGKRVRAISRSLRRRIGEAKAEVLALTGETGELLAVSLQEARALAAQAREKASARARSGKAKARREAARILAAGGWRRWPDAASRSQGRSASVWPGSRSPIASFRCSTRTRVRSARASSAPRPSLAMSSSWRR